MLRETLDFQEVTNSETSSPLSSDQTDQKPLRVLYIEDDVSFGCLVERMLARDKNNAYEISVARSSGAAQLICTSKTYDCILVDYYLPDAQGEEVAMDIKKVLGLTTPPLIFLTAKQEQHIAVEAFRLGASDFLPKNSISAESLSRAIRHAVDKHELRQKLKKKHLKLARANKELKRRENEIEGFYQTVSHDLKDPLAAAREFIALVRDGATSPITEKQVDMLTHALECCDQINSQMDELLEMSRLGTHKIHCDKKLASLDDIVLRSLASVAKKAIYKNIEINTEQVEETAPDLHIDAKRIVQVLSNLLLNAIEHTESGGSVTLKTRSDLASNYIQIIVSDTGTGIDQKHLPYIFDRLYKVPDKVQREKTGLGLGLNIAKEIVELHDGKIWAESNLEEGARFTVHIPINSDSSKAQKDSG